jgi:TRAP-type C4-dicarboxylate transport system permease small subunit
MSFLTAINRRLSRWALYIAVVSLLGLLFEVLYGVVMRYIFNDAPPYVEQICLLLVISVAMFGASVGVRDAGHIGLDSLVVKLSPAGQLVCHLLCYVLTMIFALSLLIGGYEMGVSTYSSTIPTLGISEAVRYIPVVCAGILITLFSIEHIEALMTSKKVVPSWH